jgi:hypothetical protein
MRIVLGVALLALAACTTEGGDPAAKDGNASLLATAGAEFDYRYAYRLPGVDVKAVQESHAAGCDRLGPARCRILNLRYTVDDANNVSAVLTLRIDPVIARAYGEAATKVVAGSAGALIDTEIAGADTTAAARSNALVGRLREQLANAESSATGTPAQITLARTRADRLRTTLDTIAEIEAGQGQTLATAPVLITYVSDGPATSLTADTKLRGAGQKLTGSLAMIADVLAGVGPWLALMVVAVLILRFFIHGGEAPLPEPRAAAPDGDDASREGNRIQRWFAKDDADQ